jgi:hypothetical protein
MKKSKKIHLVALLAVLIFITYLLSVIIERYSIESKITDKKNFLTAHSQNEVAGANKPFK